MRLWNLLVIAALSSLVAVACGGDDPKKDDTSNLDGKKVSELNGSELKSLCSWFDTVDDDSVSDDEACTQEAADSAESVDECEEYRDECLDEIVDEPDDCSTFSVDKACTVKVSVLKACISALAKTYLDASRGASCDDYEDAQVTALPAACKGVPDECIEIEVSASIASSLLSR